MKKIYPLLILFFFSLVLFNSCEDPGLVPEPEDPCSKYYKLLPEITVTGENTFGCMVNDEEWVAYTPPFSGLLGGTIDVEIDYDETYRVISFLINREIEEEGCPVSDESFITSVFDLDPEKENKFSLYGRYSDISKECGYKVDTFSSNKVFISKLDTVANIISGTFEVSMISRLCKDTLRFTDGRFDARYGYQ